VCPVIDGRCLSTSSPSLPDNAPCASHRTASARARDRAQNGGPNTPRNPRISRPERHVGGSKQCGREPAGGGSTLTCISWCGGFSRIVVDAAEGVPIRRSGILALGGRVFSWVLAVVASLAVVAPIAYWSGYLTKNDLLDVFVGTGTGRYTRLAVFVVVWAFVMTLAVTAFARFGRSRTNGG